MGEVGQGENELIRDTCLKKERNLSAMKMEKKKKPGMFCEIDLHGKILLKCHLGVDGGIQESRKRKREKE